jgi:hypothetical protein
VFALWVASALAGAAWGFASLATTEAPKQAAAEQGAQSTENGGGQVDPEEALWSPTSWGPITVFTFFVALFTLGLWVSTAGLWAVSASTSRRQLRAYLALDSAKVIEKNEALTVTLHFINAGQTPAYGFYAFSSTGVFCKDAKLPPIDPPDPGDADRSVVGPGRVVPYTKHITTSRVHLAAIKEGSQYGFIWGELRYRDAFNQNRFLTFAYRTGRDVRGNWILQPKGSEKAN